MSKRAETRELLNAAGESDAEKEEGGEHLSLNASAAGLETHGLVRCSCEVFMRVQ